jgi:hypothetical protein
MFKTSLYTSMESSLIKFTCLDGIRYGPISLLKTCRTLQLMTIDVPQTFPEQMLNVNMHFTVKILDSFLLFVDASDIGYFLGKLKKNCQLVATIRIFDELAQVANYLEYICPSEFFNWGSRFYAFFYSELLDIDNINDALLENSKDKIFVFIKKINRDAEERKKFIKNCILWSDLHKLCSWLLQDNSPIDKLIEEKKQSNDLRNEIILSSGKFKDEIINAVKINKIDRLRFTSMFRFGIFSVHNCERVKDQNLIKVMDYLKDMQSKIDISKLNNKDYCTEVYRLIKDDLWVFDRIMDDRRDIVCGLGPAPSTYIPHQE